MRTKVARSEAPLVGGRLMPDGLPGVAPEEALVALGSRPEGLTEAEAQARLDQVGPNLIEEVKGPGLARRAAGQFIHLFALLLWVGAALAFLAGTPALGIAIIAVILLNGVFGFFQEYRAERAVAALKRLLPPHAMVVRGGVERQIDAEGLVPGDVVILAEGDRISADGRLVEAADLRLDESSVTGESRPVHKVAEPEPSPVVTLLHAHNMVFAGSTIVAGAGRLAVSATGMQTEFGRIAGLTQAVEVQPSPLQVQVTKVAQQVALISVALGVGFFLLGYLVGGLTLHDGAIFAVGIVLANVPEGLLPTMTLALAMGVQRMAGRGAIVKRLSSVETLGSCTVICTDKTGTITRNQMTVREMWVPGRLASFSGTGYEPTGQILVDGRSATRAEAIPFFPALRIGHMCSTARLLPPRREGEEWRASGDPTEIALLVAADKAGVDREFDHRLRPLVRALAFEPKRRRMSTIHRALPQEGLLVTYVKGAPRELLDHCTHALVEGQEVPLTRDLRRQAMAENDRMARAGMRVLAMAYRYLPREDEPIVRELAPGQVEEQLVFAGLAAIQDPPREEVAAAVASCKAAGVRVIMITGDYGLTGESIAREVGIVDDREVSVIEGIQLEAMSELELRGALQAGQVLFARATPEHKLRVVASLRTVGEVVAVTGDGVNDAPALRQADIGVAMGRSGTDVAREASDMVLTDDNFATIVAAWKRVARSSTTCASSSCTSSPTYHPRPSRTCSSPCSGSRCRLP